MQRKTIFGVAIVFAVLLACTVALADVPILDATGQWEYIASDGAATNVSWVRDTEATTLLIPAEVDGLAVMEIDERTLCSPYERLQLVKFEVSPDHPLYTESGGVLFDKQKERLVAYPRGREADAYTIPSSVRDIGAYAFSGNGYLSHITLSEGTASIGNGAFSYCTSLKNITMNEGLTHIGRSAFYNCENLESMWIPASVVKIDDNPFTTHHPYTLAFIDVSPDNPRYEQIDGVLFDKQQKMLVAYPSGRSGKTYVIPDGVERIGDEAFQMCFGLESVIMPDSLKHIGMEAFLSCWSLESVIIPEGVESIGEGAFSDLQSLESIALPASVTDAAACFNTYYEPKSSSLCTITISPDNKVYKDVDGVFFDKQGTTLLAYPGGRKGVYIVPDGVKRIGDYAFTCSDLSEIVIPEGVLEIGYSAFDWCWDLESVTIPSSVTAIGSEILFSSPDAVMRVPTGSVAEQYAKENDIPYEGF